MLEQSTLHGRIFCSEVLEKTLKSKPIPVTDIKFGPMRPVQIYRISDMEMWVQDKRQGDWYHYCGKYGEKDLHLKQDENTMLPDIKGNDGFFYYYGKALCTTRDGENGKKTIEEPYFIQNAPTVDYDGIPDTDWMQMPLTMQAIDYDRVFRYPKEVKTLLSNIPACYVDRYKRPVKRVHGRTYPIPMEKVKTTWDDLGEGSYPVVVDFSKTAMAVADLEPVHTEEDLAHFNSLPGYYEEETPRGGKHKIIKVTDNSFKFRYSKGLEIINQSQVTLYGIHAKWLGDDPKVVDVSGYSTVGHKEHQVVARLERPDISEAVECLRRKASENLSTGTEIAARLYRTDPDDSHGEYAALRALYEQDIKPYAIQFKPDLLPWILEGYASNIITHRDKHETLRQGLPYLVYLAAIIIGKEDVRIWEDQKCIS